MIKSFIEMNTNEMVLLVEENPLSDIYLQVKLTDEQFEDICKIVNKKKDGFLIDTYIDRHTISDYIDITED